MTSAVLPPLPAARIASVPAKRSLVDNVDHPLAICGQVKPGTDARLQNFTSAARQSKSNLSSWVNGVWPIGKSPRRGLDAESVARAAKENRDKAAPAPAAPSVFKTARRFSS